MIKLNDKKWKPFSIKDIFITEDNGKKVQVPTGAYIHRDNIMSGKIPRITVTSLNNGIDTFCQSNHNNYRVFNNFISVSFLGTIFYHPYKASLDMKVHCLQLKDKSLNRYLAEFLVTEIRNSIVNASYGNQLSSTDLPYIKIILPIDRKGNPDYDFMEQFIKEREEKKRNEYIEYAKMKLSEIKSTIRKTNRGGVAKYKSIKLKDIFNIYTGTDLILSRIKKGNIPIISHTALNNGISNWTCLIENRKLFNHKKTISLADRGNFKAFVQKQDFYIGTRVKALETKGDIGYYSLIYLALLIDKQAVKFSYGHNACDNTENIIIEVPVENNKINYDYMENYIKSKIIKKYQDYIMYK